jgi:hypothetical protein
VQSNHSRHIGGNPGERRLFAGTEFYDQFACGDGAYVFFILAICDSGLCGRLQSRIATVPPIERICVQQ